MRAVTSRAVALGLAALLVACASSPPLTFSKPGVSAQEHKADEAACVKGSLAQGEPARPSPVPDVDRDALAQCMRVKGYTVHGR